MIEVRKTLKILQVTAALNEGGVERGTLEMAAFIVAQGAESYVASNGGKLVPELERLGAKHYVLPLAKRNPLTILMSALLLAKIMRKKNINLVHAHSRAPAWAALISCWLTKTRLITTFHGTHKIQNRIKWLYNSVMVRGDRVIAISEFILDHIVENYKVDPSCIDIAPRGFDPGKFNPEDFDTCDKKSTKRILGIKDGNMVISLPGRLTRWKGQNVFLEALGKIQDLPWQALIIGGAGGKKAYENELKKLAAHLGISDRVNFLGSQVDIARYYAISDVVVSASTEPEAFGRVAIEAQAMAIPIIASAHGGSLETIRDGVTGWLYKAGDSVALAEKMRLALSPVSDLKLMGERGAEWVGIHFSVEQMCRQEWLAYRKVLQEEIPLR